MKHLYLLTLFALTLCFTSQITAQQVLHEEEDVVVVIKEVKSKDGKTTIEKFVTTNGERSELLNEIDPEMIESIKVIRKKHGDSDLDIDVDVDSENGVRIVKVHMRGDASANVINDEHQIEADEIHMYRTDDEGSGVFVIESSNDDHEVVVTGENIEYMVGSNIEKALAVTKSSGTNCVALGVFVNTSRSGGARVSGIINGSGAEKVGMESEDLIKSINEDNVNSVADLHNALAKYEPGDIVTVSYDRNGTLQNVETELKAWGDLPGYADNWRANLKCGENNEEAARQQWEDEKHRPHSNCVALGVFVSTSGEGGAMVSRIIDGSGAEGSGLESHDLIKGIDDYTVNSVSEMHEALGYYKPGEVVRVEFERDGKLDAVEVELKGWGELPDYKDSWRANVNCGDENYQQEYNFLEMEEEVTRKVTIVKKDAVVPEPVEFNESPLEDLKDFDYTLQLDNFTVFPNPTSGRFNVRFEAEPKPLTVTIYDNSGREIFRDNQSDFNGFYNREIDLTNMSRGSLILSVAQDGKRYTDQIIIQ